MRVSEVYKSVQGEGPNVGFPTIFTRFGGCNLRCPGWPCDTLYAVEPKYRHDWLQLAPVGVAEKVARAAFNAPVNVCYTGGEPFLQPKMELRDLTEQLMAFPNVQEIECFSNGTIDYSEWMTDRVRFCMDWKLPGSGEDPNNTTRIDNLYRLMQSKKMHSVKFVCKDEDDFRLAMTLYEDYIEPDEIEVYYGVAWGSITNEALIQMVLDAGLPWKLNMQVHNYIWSRELRGK